MTSYIQAGLVSAVLLAGTSRGVDLPKLDINAFLAPPGVIYQSEKYDGFELRYGRFVFRPGIFQLEGLVLGGALLYVLIYLTGRAINRSRAYAWLQAHSTLYAQQFTTPVANGEFVADGATDFACYSTGRRGVFSLHTSFALLPRHDIVLQIINFIRGLVQLEFEPKDEISLDFRLRYQGKDGSVTPGFVWGVVSKTELKTLRSQRWDLGLFTKTTDAITVHPSLQVMTEVADINNVLLNSGAAPSLLEVLNNGDGLEYFRALVVTDQSYVRPETFEVEQPLPSVASGSRHIVLTLALPPRSQAASTLKLVEAAFELVDVVAAINGSSSLPGNHPARLTNTGLQSETVRKLKTTRKEWDERLEKERTAEKIKDEEDAKRAAKKKAEDDKVSKLSASAQQKLLEKERKRSMRKAQTRGAKR